LSPSCELIYSMRVILLSPFHPVNSPGTPPANLPISSPSIYPIVSFLSMIHHTSRSHSPASD
jgi:hypothetical protein